VHNLKACKGLFRENSLYTLHNIEYLQLTTLNSHWFWWGRKIGVPGEKTSNAGKESTINLTNVQCMSQGLNPGLHWWEVSVLPLHQPTFPHNKFWDSYILSYIIAFSLNFIELVQSYSFKIFRNDENFQYTDNTRNAPKAIPSFILFAYITELQ
jgi:hypothetical protein